jgi:hypothetical protein
MHIVNIISKGTALNRDGNLTEFYKYSTAALSTNVADGF